MSDSLFCCLEISFRPADVFGMLCCFGTFLFMSSWWLNTFTNQRSYFLDEQLECQNRLIKAAAVAFLSVICSNFTHDFGTLLHIVLLKC